jgi:glycosyltransferase involved in cell wall biosynthesis
LPKISVVVPLYNKEKHICRCLDSIFCQTIQDFELIVVNDGSTDESEKRVRNYHDSRLRLITQPNGGEASARNRGIKESSTEIIAFLDADDQWLPDFLKKVLYLREKYAEAQVFSTSVYHNDGKRFIYSSTKKMFPLHWDGIIDPRDIYRIGIPFNSSSIAINKQVFTTYGYFDEKLKIGTDSDMWFRLILLVPFAHSNEYLSEVFLDSQNRTNYEQSPSDTSVIMQKSLLEAEKFGAKIPSELHKVIDQEQTISRFLFICSSVPRNLRWSKSKTLIKMESLIRKIVATQRISFINKFKILLRLPYWFYFSLKNNPQRPKSLDKL